jgi:hypothetical protein
LVSFSERMWLGIVIQGFLRGRVGCVWFCVAMRCGVVYELESSSYLQDVVKIGVCGSGQRN